MLYALILSHRTWARRVQMSCCVGLENLCLDNIDWAWWGSLLTPGLYLTGGALLAIAIGRRIGKRRR